MEKEQYRNNKYNSEALLKASGVIGQEVSKDVNRLTKNEENPEGALQSTHVQIMDSYRVGTIDGQMEGTELPPEQAE